MWLLVFMRDPESQLPVDIERYLDVMKSKLSYEGRRHNWKQQQFLCGVLYLQWTTLLTLKRAHGPGQVSCESSFPYLWEQVLLIFGFDDCEFESSAFVLWILSVYRCFLQCIRNLCHGDPVWRTNETSSSLLHPVPYLSPPALGKYLLNKWMNKWVCVSHHSYKDKWDMILALEELTVYWTQAAN